MITTTRTARVSRAGLAATLGLGLLAAPIWISAPAATAASPTPLTGAAATTAYAKATDRAAAKASADGLNLVARSSITETGQLMWSSTVRLDARHKTVREHDYLKSFAYATSQVGSGSGDACKTDTAASGAYGTRETYLAKAGVGRWVSVRPRSYPTTDELKILGRKHTKWERLHVSNRSLKGHLRAGFTFSSLNSDLFAAEQFLGGTSTATSTGTDLVIDYRQRYTNDPITGRIYATVDASGALSAVRQVEVYSDPFDSTTDTTVTTFGLTYGAQKVTTPKAPIVVKHSHMISACHALRIREGVPAAATSVAMQLNTGAVRNHLTPALIRSTVKAQVHGTAGIRTHSVTSGIEIVGRHHLLPHAIVWTVFLRHGKAIAHRVR